MRYFAVIILIIVTLTACARVDSYDRLEYQEKELYVKGEFTVDGDSFPAELTLAAPEYDESGKMLVRQGKLIFSEGSMIEGIGFEFTGGEMYIFSGSLKIPMEEEAVIEGISSVISLFCISEDSYHSSEREAVDGISCERAVYVGGDNRVEVVIDLSTFLPISIIAHADGREIGVEIGDMKVG